MNTKWMQSVGYLLIAAGIIAGLIIGFSLGASMPDTSTAVLTDDSIKIMNPLRWVYAVLIMFAGITAGGVFLGFGYVTEIQKSTGYTQESILHELKMQRKNS